MVNPIHARPRKSGCRKDQMDFNFDWNIPSMIHLNSFLRFFHNLLQGRLIPHILQAATQP